MELRRQSGEHHLVSSMAGIELKFRQTEIRLWARSGSQRTAIAVHPKSQNWLTRKLTVANDS